jgi:N6-adenosine-specific RNA methylase IME4
MKSRSRAERKQHTREQRERELASKVLAMPGKNYGVLYADPPWRFEPYSRVTGMDRAADNHYPTMTTKKLLAMKVPAAKNCVLFLWATVPMLPQALAVMTAWGFKYKSHWVWDKVKIGTGYWSRNRHELLLVGVRGNVPAPTPEMRRASMVVEMRGRHSVKPEVFRAMIEEMYPTTRKIELFAREKMRGWSCWGNEVVDD